MGCAGMVMKPFALHPNTRSEGMKLFQRPIRREVTRAVREGLLGTWKNAQLVHHDHRASGGRVIFTFSPF